MDNRKITIPIVIVLIIAVVSLGVAFAAFSTTLNINGTAAVESTTWDIFFTSQDDGPKPTQSTTVPAANISTGGTTAENISASYVATTYTWNASFKSPGDRIVYTIYVKNGGNYNAQVSNIVKPAVQCTTDPQNACQYISYNLWTDSTGTTPLTTSFTVDAGDTEVFYLIAELSSSYGGNDGSGLVQSDLTTDAISATVTFQQTSSAISNNAGNGGNGGNSPANITYYGKIDTEQGTSADWVNSLSDLSAQDAYIKSSGGESFTCLVYNSTEYCIGTSSTTSDLETLCQTLGWEYQTEVSSDPIGSCNYFVGYDVAAYINLTETKSVDVSGLSGTNCGIDPLNHSPATYCN